MGAGAALLVEPPALALVTVASQPPWHAITEPEQSGSHAPSLRSLSLVYCCHPPATASFLARSTEWQGGEEELQGLVTRAERRGKCERRTGANESTRDEEEEGAGGEGAAEPAMKQGAGIAAEEGAGGRIVGLELGASQRHRDGQICGLDWD